MEFVNYSGGAEGTDTMFEKEGEKYGIKTVAYSFYGHNTLSKNKWNLTPEQLEDGFKMVEMANRTLKRNITTISTYVRKLLCRNWYQVKNSECIYAVGIFKKDCQEVDGGTGWAVQMAIDHDKPIYFFDQNKNKWYKYEKGSGNLDYDRFAEPSGFREISYIPPLTTKFAGVGTRNLNENGKKAIKELYRVNFIEP